VHQARQNQAGRRTDRSAGGWRTACLENLIAAVDKVRKRYPDVLLLIAGKGVLRSTLQVQIEELS